MKPRPTPTHDGSYEWSELAQADLKYVESEAEEVLFPVLSTRIIETLVSAH